MKKENKMDYEYKINKEIKETMIDVMNKRIDKQINDFLSIPNQKENQSFKGLLNLILDEDTSDTSISE
jgi:hypothetical protein